MRRAGDAVMKTFPASTTVDHDSNFFVNTYGFQIFIDRCVLYNTEILERRAALPRSSVKGQLVCASSDPVYPEPVTFQSYTVQD